MLNLVTGTPGAGKTLFTLQRLKKEFIPQKGEKQRPIYVNGIPDLDYRFFGAKELKNPDLWYELPEGSIILIDEAQRIFPQRSASKEVPKKVRQFETHRHRGYDIFLTTQDATMLDVNVRRLTGRHYFVRRVLGRERATVFEYDHYESNPTGYHEQKVAVAKTTWGYPKKLYERYKSASKHTVKKRTPLKLYLVIGVLVGTTAVIGYAVKRLTSMGDGLPSYDQVQSERTYSETSTVNGEVVNRWEIKSRESYLSLYRPIVPGVPHTAPIYDDLLQPATFPKPHCIIFEKREFTKLSVFCKCFTQQMTVYDTEENLCRYWAKNGWFDQTKEDIGSEDRVRGGMEAQPIPARSN